MNEHFVPVQQNWLRFIVTDDKNVVRALLCRTQYLYIQVGDSET